MQYMFSECSSLISLDLSNFNTSNVRNFDCMLNQCEQLEYVNLKLAKINPDNINVFREYFKYPPKLTVCSEDEDWKNLFHLIYKTYINCAYNISFYKLNETEQMMKCYKNTDDLNNPCQICGNNNYIEKSIFYDNNTYIYCYENKDGYYFDDELLEYKSCYISCKKCNMSGNDTIHNCIECKEEYKNELNLIINKNCFIDISSYIKTELIIEKGIEIENKNELIQNMINNIFNQLNISDMDNDIDKKLNDKNTAIDLV